MFCPECGTNNLDTAKFCVSCGYQTMAGGATPASMPPRMAAAVPASSGSKLPWVLAGVAFLVIAGLVGFIVMRGMNSTAQDETPTPRNRNTSNTATTASPAAPVTSAPTAAPSASSPTTAAASPTPSRPAATPAAPKVVKKVDCDKKCYQVYDQCMADYRQNPDPESICRARQQTCLINCQ